MNKFLRRLVLCFLLSFFQGYHVYSQVLINEVSSSNVTGIQNSNGDYDDWIEIYNPNGSAVDLAGYGLSDDPAFPYKFTFPTYSLGSGKRLLIFASDSTSNVVVNHYEMAVNGTSTWKYKLGTASLDTNWRNLSFNDASWSSGNGGFGYGDGDDGTTISSTISVMMRKTFTVTDTSQVLKCIFYMDYDDGFVAYLNGVEIARANLSGTGRPAWNALANSSHEATMYQGLQPDSFFIDPSFLKTILIPGTNVLSVETHDVSTSSSDMSSKAFLIFGMKNSGTTYSSTPSWFVAPSFEYFNASFKLSSSGDAVYLTLPTGITADQLTVPALENDNSYGRKPDGGSGWCYFGTPTPGNTNNNSTCYNGYASIPVFSKASGFYTSTQNMTITTAQSGGTVRYTSNGDVPTTSDPIATGNVHVTSTSTIRARVFATGYLPSPVITNNYFINLNTHLPVFAITTDSLNLWDYNTGIYVMGPGASSTSPYKGANFWQDWEKPATIDVFDKSKSEVIKFNADIKIYGNYSRAKPQKSIEIKLSNHYGTDAVNYPFWTDKPYIDKTDDIVLRNAGTDWNVVHFRDAFMERVMKHTHSGYIAAEPAIMVLNGQYWGVFTIHENHDENWQYYEYGLKKSEIDYLKEDGSTITVKQGSDQSFWDMYNYATSQTATTQAYYDYMNSVLDLQNYADYFIAETYYNNGDWIGDWTNNIKMWRPAKTGGKWKYLLYDTDFGCGYSGSVNDNRLAIARNPTAFSYSSEMFDKMLTNPTFKRYFINRYADLINTNYLPSNMTAVMQQFRDSMSYDMTAHFAKWGSNTSTWQSNINSMMSFCSSRPNIMRDFIKSQFSLTAKVTLTLNVSPAGAGRIEISTITPTTYPWSGVYFNGNPVTITAIPNPGYSFDHFRSNVVINSNNYNQSVTYNFTANDAITAYFTGSAAPANLCVSELNYNSNVAYDAGDWIELHNYGTHDLDLSGWYISDDADNHNFYFPTGTVIPANGYLVIAEDTAKFQSQFPSVTNMIGELGFNFANGGDMVRIFDPEGSVYISFTYQDLSPWPAQADGLGYTCELLSQSGDPNDGTNWFAGCIGGSPGRAFSASLSTAVTISGNSTFCSGGNTQLSATSVIGYTYQWKRNNVNISGANSPNYTATQAGTYTVAVTYQGCSVITSPFVVTTVTQSPSPVVTGASLCGPGSMTLSATATDSIFWFDAPNGNLLGTGTSFVTPVLSATTTYYARASQNCPSQYVPVSAEILVQAAIPVANDVSRCGPGVVTLTASDTAAIHWYNSPSGGGLLHTGSSYTTNIINNDTVFYVEAGDFCPSQRVEVHVTITTATAPVAFDNSRCGPGTVVLSATSSDPVFWYTTQYGGSSIATGYSFTTPNLNSTDTFYVEANGGCPSLRVPAIALINAIPSAPTVADTTICGAGVATLVGVSPEQIYWYNAAIGGTLLYTGSNFTTPVVSSTTTYYAEAGYTCRSQRTQGHVIVTSYPSAPTTAGAGRCGPGSVTLQAISPELINWYDAPAGGTLVGTGDAWVTPSLSFTTIYYAEAGTTCRSLSRTAATATINAIPADPNAPDVSRCGVGTITLNATSPSQISWYDAAIGGNLLGTGSAFTTPSLSASTTYYVEAGTSCRSGRVPVQAIITSTPPDPIVTDGARCGSGTVDLSASSAVQVNWYDQPSGGSVLGTGLAFTTPAITATTTFYADAGSGCNSNRVAVVATVNSQPSPPTVVNASRCGTGTLNLSASSSDPVYWYDAPSGGTLLNTGGSFITPSLSTTTTYYAEAGTSCMSNRVAVVATVNAVPANPVATDQSRCGTGTVALTASSTDVVNWYASPSGGISLFTGLNFTTPSISSTTTYYAQAGTVCLSARVPVAAIVNSIPSAPTASNVSRCGTGVVTLTASSPETIYWFNSSVGGIQLATGTTFTTPLLSSTTTYYVEAGNNCHSSRISVQAIINTPTADPVATDATNCGPGTVTLTASSPQTLNWYDVSSGGASLGTGSTFTTPSISVTTTYYVQAGTGACPSNRVPVQAIIAAQADAPAVFNAGRCGSGTVTLTATATETIYWYSVASGGSSIGTGGSFTTPAITSTTTYYAEAGNNCRSNRIPVIAYVNTIPPAPVGTNGTICGSGTVLLTAASPYTVNWFDAPTAGTFLGTGTSFTTPVISSTTNYYAEASSGGCISIARAAVQAIVNAQPSAPVAADVSRCGAGTVVLTASASQTIYWYNVASGGTSIATGTSFTTPSISSTTTYYVEDGASSTCRSARIPVQAIISSAPATPTVIDGTRCGTGTVVLQASSSAQINWYTVPSGGTAVSTGNTFTTPSISSTTTYYADAGSGCNSARVPVIANVNSIPAAPSANDASVCLTGSVTLTATAPETIYWFDAASGGNLVATGPSYTTPVLLTSTTYYVEDGNVCRSQRIPVQAIVTLPPATPTVTNGSRCGTGTVNLSATSTSTVNWYTALVGGTALSSGNTFVTPSISSTTTFYADAGIGCNSSRVPVIATVNALPAAPTTTGNAVCGSGSVTLNASSPETLNWYDQSSGGTLLNSGATYFTPVISSTTTYYVEAVNSNNCSSTRTAVVATINPIPAPPVTNDVSRCSTGSLTLNATSSQQIFWYDAASGGNLLATGSSYTTPVLTSSTAYYVETGDLCLSQRVQVNALITAAPNPPVLTPNYACGTGSVSLSGTASAQINWYDVPSGGTVLGIGTTFNTPVISSTTTFYAEAGFGCNSSRVSVVAEIKPVPADPVANDVLNCGPGSIQLTATSPEQIYWYDAPTGGNLLATGTSFTTPNITVATPYYVEAGDVCRSNRVEVDAIVLAISEITTIFEDSVCGSGVMSLQAVSNDPITWYDAIGGNIVGTGSIFTTPSLNSTATYYAVAGTVCPGTPVAISAIVHPLPVVELGGDTLFEEIGNVAQLDAGPGFVSYNWSTSETTQTISMTTDGYYSVTVTDGNGCQASDQIFVSFFVGIGDVENGSNVSIFPNPAHDEATIEISNLRESKAVLQILTTDGRLVFDKVIHPSGSICREKLHLADYAAGVYFVKVIAGEKTKMLRVVISN